MSLYTATTVPEGSLFRLCRHDGSYVEGAFKRFGKNYRMLEGDPATGFSLQPVKLLPGEDKLAAQIITSSADLVREVALFPPLRTAEIIQLPPRH